MCSATKQLRVIGVGSPFIKDVLGLQAVERLQHEAFFHALPADTVFHMLDRPGSVLISYLDGAQAVVLIDAMQSGQPAGTVQRLSSSELVQQGGMASSHHLGVAESLALAEVLGAMPEQLLIYGIEAGEEQGLSLWYEPLRELLQQDLLQVFSSSAAS